MRWPSSRLVRDSLLAVVLSLATQVELLLAADRVVGPLPVQHVSFAVMTSAVALRRTAPLVATLAVAAGMALQTVAGFAPVAGGFMAMLIVVATLGFYASVRAGAIGLTATAASALLYDVLAEEFVLSDLIANAVIVLGAWAFARMARVATDKRVAAEVAKDRFAREAVAAERSRIALDLHDSVAHAITVMTLQAGGARERTEDPVVAQALTSVEEGGRQALSDMHRFLKLLGDPGDGPTEAPGLNDIEDMVQRVRMGGMEVDLSVDAAIHALPASVASTAYRVVQEGLTNAIKHSDARSAAVTIRHSDGYLTVTVTNHGAGAVPRRLQGGSRRGLGNLRDRVELFDGTLSAGAVADGGWRVEARIPSTSSQLSTRGLTASQP